VALPFELNVVTHKVVAGLIFGCAMTITRYLIAFMVGAAGKNKTNCATSKTD
jgi:hypothetical protein